MIDLLWTYYAPSPDEEAVRIQHGYDADSNRLYRKNVVARAASKAFDQLYAYDGLNRLTEAKTGTLASGDASMSATTFKQAFTLDAVGNWNDFDEAATGGSWTLEQARTFNKVNEITGISQGGGQTQWDIPTYDAAGNMTLMPRPALLTESFWAKYDAWNRMVELREGSSTGAVIARYQYDGRNFRIVRQTDFSGDPPVPATILHDYFTSGWQLIETRADDGSTAISATAPSRQYLWGLRYIDDLIFRDRATGTPSSGMGERLYALQDANFNVTTLTQVTTGTESVVVQRFEYDAYGQATVLDADWDGTTDGYEWDIRYAGYRFDSESSLNCARNRYLHSQLGLWGSRDPVGYLDGFNLYQYANAGPSQVTDPMGLYSDLASTRSITDWNNDPRGSYTDLIANISRNNDSLSSLATQPSMWYYLSSITIPEKCCSVFSIDAMYYWQSDPDPKKAGTFGYLMKPSHDSDIFINTGVDTVSDMLQRIRYAADKCACFRSLSILTHGIAPEGGFRFADYIYRPSDKPTHRYEWIYNDLGGPHSTPKDTATKFGQKIKGAMCKDCTINIMSCSAASSDSWSLKAIAKASGCKVRGTIGRCRPLLGFMAELGVMEADPNGGNRQLYPPGHRTATPW